MKFLFIGRFKDIFYTLPQEKRVELAAGGFAFADKYVKSGKCKELNYFTNFTGHVSIWEFESNEESARIFLENPMRQYTEFEEHPVLDDVTASKVYRAVMADAQKAVKK
jgi:hypothetical protein